MEANTSTHADSILIQKTLSGEMEAFDTLMQRYQKLVYKICYGFGKNKENALDMSQNVFLKIYQKMSSFRGDSSFKSWLVKISYNEGVNWMRHNKQSLNQESLEDYSGLHDSGPSREDEMLARENKSQLIHSLYALNTRYRLAVILRYFEGNSIKEIAEILQCSEGVVKNMLFRSLKKLREQMQQTPA